MRIAYPLLSYVTFGALLPFLSAHPKLRGGFKRRMGLYEEPSPWPPSRSAAPRVWVHGASAGDLLAVNPIISELRTREPGLTIIVSTMTSSGYQIARDRLRASVDAITYVPWDLPGATRRAVHTIRPDLLILEYTEVWPNLIAAASSAGAAVALTNGRFSESLVRRYRMLFGLTGNPLEAMDLLLMREEVEAERALALGAPRERVLVTGNTKFDNVSKGPDEAVVKRLAETFAFGEAPVFVAGSTHEGEERELIAAYVSMREVAPSLRMIVAPRYPERGARVAGWARDRGLRTAQRSTGTPEELRSAEVIVLDSIGELLAAYRLGTLVFVGGSFVSRGGQNILEPASQGRPVLFGPNMANFRDSVEVLLGRGGIQVATPRNLAAVARELLGRPDEMAHLGTMAKEAVQKVRGASARNADALLALLARRAGRALPPGKQ